MTSLVKTASGFFRHSRLLFAALHACSQQTVSSRQLTLLRSSYVLPSAPSCRSLNPRNSVLFQRSLADLSSERAQPQTPPQPPTQNDQNAPSSSNVNNDSKENNNENNKKWYHAWTGKNVWKLGALSMSIWLTTTGVYILFNWGAPLQDENGNVISDEFSDLPAWQQYPLRAWRELRHYQQMIQDPSSDKLLPDPLREPYFQPPYTLVIELMGVLVHPDWTYKTGWRFRKRPGLEYFLKSCGYPLFEVVIFTQEPALTAHPLIDGLDPNNMVMYRLYRDSTRYAHGVHIKDLSCLNRDLSKVIFIDWDVKTGKLQPRNMLPLPKWHGEDNDTALVDLASFLRTLALSGVDDVRPVLEHYRQFDDPLFVFRENQRKLAAAEQEKMKNASASGQLLSSGSKSWLSWRR